MVKDHSVREKIYRCHMFFYMHHPTDRIAHTTHSLCYTSRDEMRNGSVGPP